MSALLGKAGKKLFEKNLEKYAPADPLYEEYVDKNGKKKRRRRELPPGLSKRDEKILKSVKRRAHYLDKGFSICGMRFGWTFIIGVIPGAGDAADAALNYFLVVRKARKADIPSWLLQRMLMNNAVSAAVGFVPFVGDVVLAMYKANSRNAALLEEFLRIRGEEFLKLQAAGKNPEAAADPSVPVKKDRKGKEKDVAKGVTKSDAEQVKPGAGREENEVGTSSSNAMPGGLTSVVANVPGPEEEVKPQATAARSASRKRFLWRMSSGGKSDAPTVAGEQGRFIENVDTKKH